MTTQVEEIGVEVSKRAMIQRINRILGPQERQLKITRGEAMRQQVGDWYVIDYCGNRILQCERSTDFEHLAHELGALKDWEFVR